MKAFEILTAGNGNPPPPKKTPGSAAKRPGKK